MLWVITANAQTASFPHEVFDPLNIPRVEGAKLLYADKGSAGSCPLVVYDATPQQVMAWIGQMDNRGFLHRNSFENYGVYNTQISGLQSYGR